MLGLKLSNGAAGDLRIFKSDFEQYVRECSAAFSRESAAVTGPCGGDLKLRRQLSKADQTRKNRERAMLDAMLP